MKPVVLGIAAAGLLVGVSYAQTTMTNPNTATTPTANPTVTGRPTAPAEVRRGWHGFNHTGSQV